MTEKSHERRIIVIGGSIAGLFVGAFLRRIGWRVDIYERSSIELIGRGVGIFATHLELFEALDKCGAGTVDIGVIVYKRVTFDHSGDVIAVKPQLQIVTSWDRLRQVLLKAIDRQRYHFGHAFERVEQDGNNVQVYFANGHTQRADLVVGCDGFRSSVRAYLAPEVQPIYSGYYIWRGAPNESVGCGIDQNQCFNAQGCIQEKLGVRYSISTSIMSAATALTDRFDRALLYATHVHGGQVRKETTIPYIAHLLAVAATVLEYGGSEDMAIAGLLHDAAEDQGGEPRLADIRNRFGDRVADIVHACSDSVVNTAAGEQKDDWRTRKTRYIEHLKTVDRETCLVSLSDKVHNARSILRDLRKAEIGSAVWSRFGKRPKEDTLWYYRELADAFQGVLPGQLAEELMEIVIVLENE